MLKGDAMTARRFTDEEEAAITAMYQGGATPTAIAREYSSHAATIHNVIRRHSVRLHGRGTRKLTDKQEREVAKRYAKGASLNALAPEYNCNPITIRNIVRRRGGTLRRRGAVAEEARESVQRRILVAYGQGASQQTIARELGVSQSVVSRVVRRAGTSRPNVRSRDLHGRWGGGRIKVHGYIFAWVSRDDPLYVMVNSMGYVPEHRLVLARHLGRPLERYETVHHINGNREDNRVKNLELRSSNHGSGVSFRCLDCGSTNVEAVALD
jgi:transposase-like protein